MLAHFRLIYEKVYALLKFSQIKNSLHDNEFPIFGAIERIKVAQQMPGRKLLAHLNFKMFTKSALKPLSGDLKCCKAKKVLVKVIRFR